MSPVQPAATYVVIDAENLDRTIGEILGRRPSAGERVNYQNLVAFCSEKWPKPLKCLVCLNVRGEQVPEPMLGFVQALRASKCDVVPLYGRPDQKVVDIAIVKLLNAMKELPAANVVLGSHDGEDFAPHVAALLGGQRSVAVLGFREFFSQKFRELVPQGLQLYDLEYDARVLPARLPRLVPIPVDEFDPKAFL
jgi:uncharacterized protein